ncbi:hypothetical protein ACO22_04407 [Paracoccidioides brasiliensis]|uniref:BZIP domain-containing protein n=1 Tax=Paracoccidioides brasiliensis TaxID=121759 RepID=A0A1D2JD64_PARBR|nr:hypothetical protein ACO22_04407 [Paracoccidioides brasiliensis]
MFGSSGRKNKNEIPLMVPIERSRREIRREKNRLAQRRHREAKRRGANKIHVHEIANTGQEQAKISSVDKRKSESPCQNEADPIGLNYFEKIGNIPDALEAGQTEKELIDELADIGSSWGANFYQENPLTSHPAGATPETAALHNSPLSVFPISRRQAVRTSDIHHWSSNSDSSPLGPPVPLEQTNSTLIPIGPLDNRQSPLFFESYHSLQSGSEPTPGPSSRLPDLSGSLFHSEDIKKHKDHQFHNEPSQSHHFDDSFRLQSQELMETIAQTSGRSNSTCRNKRRRTTYGGTEHRLEKILSTIEEAGYESLDAAAAEYYTAEFPKDTLLASEQFHSRTRRLSRFLHQVHQGSKTWSEKESTGYRDAVLRAIEDIFRDEVYRRAGEPNELSFDQRSHTSQSHSSMNSPLMFPHGDPGISESISGVSPQDTRILAYTAVQNLLRDRDLAPVLMQDVSRLQNTVPEIFTLLTELVRASGLRRPDQSIAVCLFLQMLGI